MTQEPPVVTELDKCILSLYIKGLSISKISEELGITSFKVYKVLKSLNVNFRDKSDANKKKPDHVFCFLYNLGLSASQIALLLNLDRSTVIKRLNKINFQARNIYVARNIMYSRDEFDKFFFKNESFRSMIECL